MKHRIRAAGIVERDGKLLLVEHEDARGNRWWIPPGGGLEDVDETLYDCLRREVFEETGQQVEVGRLRYLREFIDRTNATRHLELFYDARIESAGAPVLTGLAPILFDPMIKSVQWLGKEEMNRRIGEPSPIAPRSPIFSPPSVESSEGWCAGAQAQVAPPVPEAGVSPCAPPTVDNWGAGRGRAVSASQPRGRAFRWQGQWGRAQRR